MIHCTVHVVLKLILSCTEFPPRDGEEHRRQCYEWLNLETEDAREEFFTRVGVRWSEFARLEYFDMVRWTVVDPMHNLLLGKSHFSFEISSDVIRCC